MNSVKQSESKKPFKLNNANSKTIQNVSNTKTNQNYIKSHRSIHYFSLNLLVPHRSLLVKINEKNKLKLTEKYRRDKRWHDLFFPPYKFRSSVIKKLPIKYGDKLKYMSSKQNTMWY